MKVLLGRVIQLCLLGFFAGAVALSQEQADIPRQEAPEAAAPEEGADEASEATKSGEVAQEGAVEMDAAVEAPAAESASAEAQEQPESDATQADAAQEGEADGEPVADVSKDATNAKKEAPSTSAEDVAKKPAAPQTAAQATPAKPTLKKPKRLPPVGPSKARDPKLAVKPQAPKKPTFIQSKPISPKTVVRETKVDEKTVKVEIGDSEDKVGSDLIPPGQELVNIDFPEPTDIKDIIRAVSLWTGKNVILGRDVSGKVQMISPRKVTKVEAYQAFLSALNLLGLTTVETGKVIKIIPVRTAVKANLKTFLGSSWTPMTDELITQIVPLKYINAKDIQTKLARIVSSNSMIAYEPTNTLIISDSGFNVRRILDIIELLDVQTQQPKLSVVPIKYGDAAKISTMVSDIFKARTTTKGARTSGYNRYKILTDERTNSVVIFGPPRTIADVKRLVRKFDVTVDDPSRQSSIHVRPLDYADATKLATTLSSLAGNKNRRTVRRPPIRASKGKATASAPPVANLDNDLKITSDEASNSLLITGSRSAYDALNTIIRKLDVRKSQVFIETEILDLDINGGFEFGTSIFAGAGSSDEDGTKVPVTWEPSGITPLIVAQASGSDSTQTATAAAGAFNEGLTVGVLSGTKVNIPGLGEISPGALIKMLKRDGNTRVLSSPHILTANNEEAKFTVGQKLFFRSPEVNASTGVSVNKVENENVNLSLEMKPNISHSNYITMKIDIDASTGRIDPASQLPDVIKRKSSQTVTVKNGQTVVISGLVKQEELEIYTKIPLLGDIPILGWLFRNTRLQKARQNLMIFVTPHVVHGANDLASIYERKVKERDEFMEKVYGSDFKDSDFYALLPQKSDGAFKADAYDAVDERMRKQRRLEMMRDMGYGQDEIKQFDQGGEAIDPSLEEDKNRAQLNTDDDEDVEMSVFKG